MREKEIIKTLTDYCENKKEMMKETLVNAIKCLLCLYKKEKVKNRKTIIMGGVQYISKFVVEKKYISKDELRAEIRKLEPELKLENFRDGASIQIKLLCRLLKGEYHEQ